MIKIKSLQEALEEQAQAKKGNWKDGALYFVSITGIEGMKEFELIDKSVHIIKLNKSFMLYKSKHKLQYILGYWDKEEKETKNGVEYKDVFIKIWVCDLSLQNLNMKEYSNVIKVDGVVVDIANSFKDSGISTFMYKYFVKILGFTMLGDSEQYFGARKLWTRLSKELDVIVDIVDIKSKEILYSDVTLHHGNQDSDFDKRLWSYSKDKHYVRSILKDIK